MTEVTRTTVLTVTDVGNQLRSSGLDALGITIPSLSRSWSAAAPGTADDTTLRLTLTGVRAPFTGIFRYDPNPTTYSAVDGTPVAGPVGVLGLHPEAIHRLETLLRTRLGPPLRRPVPVTMLIHGVTVPTPTPALSWFRGGEDLGIAQSLPITFHDRRGLIIDPVAVASMFTDLLAFRPGLAATGSTSAADSVGGVATIAALSGPAVRIHVISPHGAAYRVRRVQLATMEVLTATGTSARVVPATGLVDLATGEQIGRAASHAAADTAAGNPLLWGFTPGGSLDTTPLVPPTLPTGANLPRQFLRVMAVDLDWHLLGNRDFVRGDPAVPGEDNRPASPLPVVRKTVPRFDYLIDGNDVLGAMGQVSATLPASADRRALLCSPLIEPTLGLPPAPGPLGHWPAFPPGPVPTPADGARVRRYDATGAATPTAAWRAVTAGPLRDVVITFPGGSLPPGTHIRVYPRTFQLIAGIGEDPSFVRGDGGAALVPADPSTARVLLLNPFGLNSTEAAPDSAILSVDIVAVARDGTRRLLSAMNLPVAPPTTFVDDPTAFGGGVPTAVAVLLLQPGATAIAPTSTFGIPPVPELAPLPDLGGNPSLNDLLTAVRGLANETTSPRVGPHLPTQARFDTVLAVGAVPAGGTNYQWEAVLTGARWGAESRSASPDLGDPGNPAGPDTQITGIRASGQLAYDLAVHAIKRTQPVIPFNGNQGWLVQTAGDNFDVPAADPPPTADQSHIAAAVLETIAPFVDSPELSTLPIPGDNAQVTTLVGQIATLLEQATPALPVLTNLERLLRQLQREIATARAGQRDAMWSLARAITEAREYVLIESPMFARTARPDTSHPETGLWDLVTLLADRLTANPRLKVLVCVPRLPDFPASPPSWFRAALSQRTDALQRLIAAAGDRVAAFHPVGFPGRAIVGRSTVVLVDDVYALVGTSHWRRRGMTFDGGCDIASLDRRLNDRGVSTSVARFRQELLATRLGVPIPAGAATTSALWTRLAEPESAFDALRDLLAAGGLGQCSAVWAGPTDTTVIPEDPDTSDPNGLLGVSLMTLLAGLKP